MNNDAMQTTLDPVAVAVEYLLAIRAADHARVERAALQLRTLTRASLSAGLPNDPARLSFWLNLYNGSVLRRPTQDLHSWRARLTFFRRPQLEVAGQALSLDEIEHGILRRSRWRLGLGFVSDPRPSSFERTYRVERLDPRVHFALNCAAASCPPIAAYRADEVDRQLDRATRSYLAGEVEVAPDRITIPRIFLWFAGDFGGPRGIRSFLDAHGVDGAGRPIRFARYDWTTAPARWTNDIEPDDSRPTDAP